MDAEIAEIIEDLLDLDGQSRELYKLGIKREAEKCRAKKGNGMQKTNNHDKSSHLRLVSCNPLQASAKDGNSVFCGAKNPILVIR